MFYKFLTAAGRGPYSRFAWPLPTQNLDGSWTPGAWVTAEGPLVVCANGIHLCREGDLLEWLQARLFEIEGDGVELIEANHKVVVRRARLVREIITWNERTARLFACDCAEIVLPLWEAWAPDDARPRETLAVARRYARGETTTEELATAWTATWATSRDGIGDAAWDAARGAARLPDLAATKDAAGAAVWAAAWAAWDAAWATGAARAAWAATGAAWAAAWATRAAAGAAWAAWAAAGAAWATAWDAAGATGAAWAAWEAARATRAAAWAAKAEQLRMLLKYLRGEEVE
jgi:hypothetical protein